ncbi:MAG: PfkB family carbohydrate kinase [Anaerolineae bacterium]|nr:PfkB family carbohydrate kinase [Anaerolineae bacterium]
MPDVITLGEVLVDFVATVSGVSLADAPAFKKAPGGAPANVAAALARLGVSAGFMGKVGDDPFGHFLVDTLRALGVDTAAVRWSAEARTALAFVSLRADGERDFAFYRHPSADMLYRPDDVDLAYICGAKVFHFGSISLIGEPSRSATLLAAETARDAGLLVSYDPNLRLALWPSAQAAREGILRGWRLAHVIKVSEEELAFLGGDEPEAARRLWHDALRLLVVTRGRAGCTYVTPALSGDVPGFSVRTVDTTGAGDGFVAGMLKGLLETPEAWGDEARLRGILRYANAVGALATTRRGAIPAMPTPRQVERLLRGRRGDF